MRWIVVDGIDGSGKTTFANWIKEYYELLGESTAIFVHPSTRFFGRISRTALRGSGKLMKTVAGTFFILDVLGSLRKMGRIVGRHENVVFVRYLMATAYLPARLARLGYDFFAALLPVPDRLILVDIEPVTAHMRISKRREEREMFETVPDLTRIRRKMLAIADESWTIIDNSGSGVESKRSLIETLARWDSQRRGPSAKD